MKLSHVAKHGQTQRRKKRHHVPRTYHCVNDALTVIMPPDVRQSNVIFCSLVVSFFLPGSDLTARQAEPRQKYITG